MKKILIGLGLLFVAYLVYDRLNYNFCQASIHLKKWPHIQTTAAHTPEKIEQVRNIVAQPFTFLGKGRQMYAFASQDGKYVLKLVRCSRFNGSEFFDNFPLPRYFQRMRHFCLKERQSRYDGLFISINLCEQELAEQTGTIYAHIQPTKELNKVVTVKDRLGFSHEVDLDSVPFVIQRRAASWKPTLESLLKEKNMKALDLRLDQLIDLIVQRAKVGIVDPDGRLLQNNNLGYVDDRAIYIDMGTFYRSYKSTDRPHLESDFRQIKPIVALLKSHDPKLAKAFTMRMQAAIQSTATLTPA